MLRVAIVEDDREFAMNLVNFLEEYEKEKSIQIRVRYFQDGEDIVENYHSDYDLILMDIQMRFMNGMEAAGRIREADNKVLIVFITNEAQFAIAGYEVRAFDFLVKPVSFETFTARMDRCLGQLRQTPEDYLLLPLSDGAQRVDIYRILYVESRGHTMEVHTPEGIIRTNLKMSDLEDRLRDKNFFRCHKGYLINLEAVEKLEGDHCVIGGESIPVSRRKKTELLDALTRVI